MAVVAKTGSAELVVEHTDCASICGYSPDGGVICPFILWICSEGFNQLVTGRVHAACSVQDIRYLCRVDRVLHKNVPGLEAAAIVVRLLIPLKVQRQQYLCVLF